MLEIVTGFFLGVFATVCAFRWLDRCWIWERADQIYGDDYGAEGRDRS